MKPRVSELSQQTHGHSQALPLPHPPLHEECVRRDWKGPFGGNHVWRSANQAGKSTSTKVRTHKPHGVKSMRRGPVTGQVQYHNTTPWVSAMRDLYLSLRQIRPGNLTEAETTVPQN